MHQNLFGNTFFRLTYRVRSFFVCFCSHHQMHAGTDTIMLDTTQESFAHGRINLCVLHAYSSKLIWIDKNVCMKMLCYKTRLTLICVTLLFILCITPSSLSSSLLSESLDPSLRLALDDALAAWGLRSLEPDPSRWADWGRPASWWPEKKKTQTPLDLLSTKQAMNTWMTGRTDLL